MIRVRRFRQSNRGVTSIEYALLAALIAMAIIGAAATVGTNLSALYDQIQTAVTNATSH